MNGKPIKKVNVPFVLIYALVPILAVALVFWVGITFFRDSPRQVSYVFTAAILLGGAWYVLVGSSIYNRKKKQMMKDLDAQGFHRNHTFYAGNTTVVVDVEQGKLALLFHWNPFEVFVVPASRVTKAWTDDGAHGPGIMRGTQRVSFLFVVDGVRVRVNTFTSNRPLPLNDAKVLEGISKADLMVRVLASARQSAGA